MAGFPRRGGSLPPGGNRLQLLSEYAAVSYEPEEDEDTAGLLGVIFRESIVGRLGEGEVAIPFTSLTLVESDGRPFIADWIETYGAERWPNDSSRSW